MKESLHYISTKKQRQEAQGPSSDHTAMQSEITSACSPASWVGMERYDTTDILKKNIFRDELSCLFSHSA